MSRRHKIIGRFAVLAACCGMTAAIGLASAQEDSVLVKKPVTPIIEGPALAAPDNELTLPPPERPATEPAAKTQAERATRSAAKQLLQPAIKRPFMRPAESQRRVPATTALAITEEPMPAPEMEPGEEIEIRPTPPIEYDTDRDARRMYSTGQIELVMVTQNPGDGCFYEIPMCIPACCTGEPMVSSGQGIFGRGIVEYCWECGFRAKVKFRHVLGDVEVEYEGD